MEAPFPKYYLYKRIVQAKLFMDAHFGEAIDLDNIADEAYFSKFHFVRLFKSIYGKTPHQYLIHVRIDKAKECLQKGLPVTETVFRIGFDSVSSFTGLFRKYTGTTPSAWQQQYRERQALLQREPLRFIPNCFAEQKGWTENSNFQEV